MYVHFTLPSEKETKIANPRKILDSKLFEEQCQYLSLWKMLIHCCYGATMMDSVLSKDKWIRNKIGLSARVLIASMVMDNEPSQQ